MALPLSGRLIFFQPTNDDVVFVFDERQQSAQQLKSDIPFVIAYPFGEERTGTILQTTETGDDLFEKEGEQATEDRRDDDQWDVVVHGHGAIQQKIQRKIIMLFLFLQLYPPR